MRAGRPRAASGSRSVGPAGQPEQQPGQQVVAGRGEPGAAAEQPQDERVPAGRRLVGGARRDGAARPGRCPPAATVISSGPGSPPATARAGSPARRRQRPARGRHGEQTRRGAAAVAVSTASSCPPGRRTRSAGEGHGAGEPQPSQVSRASRRPPSRRTRSGEDRDHPAADRAPATRSRTARTPLRRTSPCPDRNVSRSAAARRLSGSLQLPGPATLSQLVIATSHHRGPRSATLLPRESMGTAHESGGQHVAAQLEGRSRRQDPTARRGGATGRADVVAAHHRHRHPARARDVRRDLRAAADHGDPGHHRGVLLRHRHADLPGVRPQPDPELPRHQRRLHRAGLRGLQRRRRPQRGALRRPVRRRHLLPDRRPGERRRPARHRGDPAAGAHRHRGHADRPQPGRPGRQQRLLEERPVARAGDARRHHPAARLPARVPAPDRDPARRRGRLGAGRR